MRPFLLACMLVVVAVACSVDAKEVFTGYPFAIVQDEQSMAQNSVPDADTAYISVEIVFHAIQAEQYPVTAAALQRAMTTWASNLPIRLTVFVEDPRSPVTNPFPNPVPMPSYLGRPGIVKILMEDLQAPGRDYPEGLLGLWLPYEKRVLLDADLLETNPELAYSVCLHELGHMFGVPHLVGMNQPAPTGWLVLPEGVDPSDYVMYPGVVKDKSQNVLSPVEIAIARNHVLYQMTTTWYKGRKENCELTREH